MVGVMKNININKLTVMLGVVLMTSSTLADNHTYSIGYAQNKIEDFKSLKGINVQHRYEWNEPLSLVSSISYLEGDAINYENATTYYDTEVKYFSFLMGPAYRFNNYISAYALVGAAKIKVDDREYNGTTLEDAYINTALEFAYGAGLIVNPIQNLSINMGYEGTTLKGADGSSRFTGFNVGVGYRF